VGEQLVSDVQPIGNALPGANPRVPRRPCGHGDVQSVFPDFAADERTGEVEFAFGAVTATGAACRDHHTAAIQLRQGGRLAPVTGNGRAVVLDADFPEGGRDGSGALEVVWRWRNWCGGPGVMAWRVVSPPQSARRPDWAGWQRDADLPRPVQAVGAHRPSRPPLRQVSANVWDCRVHGIVTPRRARGRVGSGRVAGVAAGR